MDPYPAQVCEELAAAWQERSDADAADSVRAAIKAIPDCRFTPEVLAQIAACLSDKCSAFYAVPRSIAREYLDDLCTDMQGARDEH